MKNACDGNTGAKIPAQNPNVSDKRKQKTPFLRRKMATLLLPRIGSRLKEHLSRNSSIIPVLSVASGALIGLMTSFFHIIFRSDSQLTCKKPHNEAISLTDPPVMKVRGWGLNGGGATPNLSTSFRQGCDIVLSQQYSYIYILLCRDGNHRPFALHLITSHHMKNNKWHHIHHSTLLFYSSNVSK